MVNTEVTQVLEAAKSYCLDTISFAEHLGWKSESLFADHGSPQALLEHFKNKMNLEHEQALDFYRGTVMIDVDEYLQEKQGLRK